MFEIQNYIADGHVRHCLPVQNLNLWCQNIQEPMKFTFDIGHERIRKDIKMGMGQILAPETNANDSGSNADGPIS
jgi:hypothetical protein